MKKLITVCWSTTIEAEIPDGVTIDELNGDQPHKAINEHGDKIISNAARNLDYNWAGGVITDIQDVEDPYEQDSIHGKDKNI